MANENKAYKERYGNLTPGLASHIESSGGHELIPVVIVLRDTEIEQEQPQQQFIDSETYQSLSSSEKKALLESEEARRVEMDAYLKARARRILAPFEARLSNLGAGVHPDSYFLQVSAKLSAEAIEEVNKWPEVRMIDLDSQNQPELNVTRPSIGATTVHSRGVTGTGVKVGIVDLGGRIATANPFLAGTFQDSSTVCATPDEHTTALAGIVRSTDSTGRGIAPGAALWTGGSCLDVWDELRDRSHGAADWGAKVLNLSWGADTGRFFSFRDIFYDQYVQFRSVVVVKSAGNRGSDCGLNGNVTSPGLAYNVITVGGFKDHNTVDWADDNMYECSSWNNPFTANNDLEKPELVAPSHKIYTTTVASPWLSQQNAIDGSLHNGTSFAAPHVASLAALLMQRDPYFVYKPNLVKAIILACAAHNIEDGPIYGYRDGAGAISALWADDIASRFMGSWGLMPYACTFQNPQLGVTLINLPAGLRTRVAIAWIADTANVNYPNVPSADINLEVRSPNGISFWSSSFDGTYEIVDFDTPVAGNYSLYLWRRNCASVPGSAIAYAYWQAH
ncbi:MAG: S8 family serine peptidase [Blastocatellia bacterium]